MGLHHTFGLEMHRRNNTHILDHDVMASIVGNTVQIRDLISGDVQYLFGHQVGVGAIAVDPSRKFLAVAEKGTWPCVYIYEYPSLRVHRVLRKGTEAAFSAVTFSADGEKLATVGSFPDFLLTVWNWRTESMVLRSKAFSQEVRRRRGRRQWRCLCVALTITTTTTTLCLFRCSTCGFLRIRPSS